MSFSSIISRNTKLPFLRLFVCFIQQNTTQVKRKQRIEQTTNHSSCNFNHQNTMPNFNIEQYLIFDSFFSFLSFLFFFLRILWLRFFLLCEQWKKTHKKNWQMESKNKGHVSNEQQNFMLFKRYRGFFSIYDILCHW